MGVPNDGGPGPQLGAPRLSCFGIFAVFATAPIQLRLATGVAGQLGDGYGLSVRNRDRRGKRSPLKRVLHSRRKPDPSTGG